MWLNSVVSALLLHLIAALEIGDHCNNTEELSDGICTLLDDCQAAISELEENEIHPYKRCGFQKDEEVLCCPQLPKVKYDISKADRECQKIIGNEKVLPPRSLHIFGGEVAAIGEFPHMVALGYVTDAGYDFGCGGALISDKYVVTAGHCVIPKDRVPPTIVRIGAVDVSDKNFNSRYDIYIDKIVEHPEYKPSARYYDIALIRLNDSVQWNNNKYPACLYTEQEDPRIPLTITGWGATDTTANQKSEQLLKAKASLIPLQNCSQVYVIEPQMIAGVTNNQLCAVDPNGTQDTCKGDSGGPLQGQTSTTDPIYRLVGVTSLGYNDCGIGMPAIYTRIASYLDWIESVVWPD